MLLRACGYEFRFPRPALVMGILNVTPDSFYDGGQFLDPQAAIEHGLEMAAQGAEIIDVGGESSRPEATAVSEEAESQRVLPVIKGLARQLRVPISVDTMKPGVARAALEAGASIVNDVAANRSDETMWRVVAEAGAAYVCMHMQGTPQTMQIAPRYKEVVSEVQQFFLERIQRLKDCRVKEEQVIIDPGIGFGKNVEHNLLLLGSLSSFSSMGRPVLVGASRKAFIGKLLGLEVGSRLPAALACACLAVQSGVNLIRAHDVGATVQAIRMTEALLERQSA